MRVNSHNALSAGGVSALTVAEQASLIGQSKLPGSNETIAGANGEINASNTRDAIRQQMAVASFIRTNPTQLAAEANEVASARAVSVKRKQAWEAACADVTLAKMAELGASISMEITERIERNGFMRRVLSRMDLGAGSTPRIATREAQVNAVLATGPTSVGHQVVRQKYVQPEEFNIVAHPMVTEIDLSQGNDDILDRLRQDGEEAIMTQEDRLLLAMLKKAASLDNDPVYYTGVLTPQTISALLSQVSGWRVPTSELILADDLVKDIQTGAAFNGLYNPITQLEIMLTGKMGTLFGATVNTDGFRDPQQRVLNDGEIYVLTSGDYLGAYSDRGPIQAEPRVNTKDFPGRGWYMWEQLSMALASSRGVARGERIG